MTEKNPIYITEENLNGDRELSNKATINLVDKRDLKAPTKIPFTTSRAKSRYAYNLINTAINPRKALVPGYSFEASYKDMLEKLIFNDNESLPDEHILPFCCIVDLIAVRKLTPIMLVTGMTQRNTIIVGNVLNKFILEHWDMLVAMRANLVDVDLSEE